MFVVGQKRVDVELEGPGRQLYVLLEVGEDLVIDPKGPSELVLSGSVPNNVIGEELIQLGDVAGGERLVAPADKVLVGMGHGFSLLWRAAGKHPPAGLPVESTRMRQPRAGEQLRHTRASPHRSAPSAPRTRRQPG